MKIRLDKVVISFPSVFNKATYQGLETKYEATFLLNKKMQEDQEKQKDNIHQLDEVINKLKGFLQKEKIPQSKALSMIDTLLRDGDEKDYEGYAGTRTLKGRSNSPIYVIDKAKRLVKEEDGLIYGGAIVNAIVQFYIHNNKLCCALNGVQWVSSGTKYGASNEDSHNDFEVLETPEKGFDDFNDVPF